MWIVQWFFFFNDTATTEIYTLSLHDALPDLGVGGAVRGRAPAERASARRHRRHGRQHGGRAHQLPVTHRSEEHTSELQSRQYLVCRLLLEKKKNNIEKDVFQSSPTQEHTILF